MAAFTDFNVPEILVGELLRPHPQYIAKHIARPRVIYDFSKGVGDTVQIDRFHFWADNDVNAKASLTQEARERSDLQVIGTGNSRELSKDKVILTLREFTGPASATDPTQPSTFQIGTKQLMTAQHNYWQYGERAFHESIGSANLIDDFRRWEDCVYINEYLKTVFIENPNEIPLTDGTAVDLSNAVYGGKAPKWRVEDSERVLVNMMIRNTPVYEDGSIVCLSHWNFLKDLRRDDEFREIARYPGTIPVTQMAMPKMPGEPDQIMFNGSGGPAPMVSPYYAGILGNQAYSIGGGIAMPTGFVFNGIRYFTTSNMPNGSQTLNYSGSGDLLKYPEGSAVRTAALGTFYGQQALGIGLGGPGPMIRLSDDNDFQRFIIAIWCIYGVWKLLDDRFVTTARSFQN